MVNIIKQIIHNIQLSSSSSDVKKTLIKQNSNDTHILSITLYDKNDIITIDPDWKIALSAKKPDNTYVVNENKEKIEISDNMINITVTRQILAVPGTVKCELSIYKPDKTTYFSDTFLIYVQANVVTGSELESTNEFDSIVDTLSLLKKYEQNAMEAMKHIDNIKEEMQEYLLSGMMEPLSDTEPDNQPNGLFWLKEY
ncbi:MAG: BppU family phage baseplate upper protein [Eubacterium sp.]|nr:BppU family phage baseplate upper protein [Eubacterium sp.]